MFDPMRAYITIARVLLLSVWTEQQPSPSLAMFNAFGRVFRKIHAFEPKWKVDNIIV